MTLFDKMKAVTRLATILGFASVAACEGNNSGIKFPITSVPEVMSTSPAGDTLGVEINKNVTATFNKPMNAETIDSYSFTVGGVGETALTGTVTYDATTDTAIFTPGSSFGAETVYEATITTAAEDAEGNALANDVVWQFTTGSADDVTPPDVTSTKPSNNATDVPRNRNVAATFSEDVNPSTVTEETFTVIDADGNAVAGSVSVVGTTTAVFNPAEDFQSDTNYTASISTGVSDLASPANVLATAFVWSFATGATVAAGPAPVALGTAGDYVILAKSEITTTGTTAIVGDIGISPAARSYITGFEDSLDTSTEFATSDLVIGRLYAADMTLPTPSDLTTAISNMETAYTDAAGRPDPDVTELGAGDISGETLEPGLYAWGTNLLIAADITLSGSADDVWILQIAQDLTVNNGVAITLEGGALPENIYWQVAGQVTLGTTSDFKGVILSKTKIVLQTGAVLNGRALAQTAVNLDANAITEPTE